MWRTGNRTRSLSLLALLAGQAANAGAPQIVATASNSMEILAPSAVDMSGATIGTITIENGSIFDLDNPAEDKALYRFANRAHVTTRADVIEAQLLFESGDEFSVQKIKESERLLRTNRYIQEVSIEPVLTETGKVDIDITTSDVWTLIPKLDISRSGGENKSSIGVKEMNLLGTGMAVEVQFRSDVDRDSTSLRFNDRNIGHSRYSISTYLADNSDGHHHFLQFGQPFYSLDSRTAKGITVLDIDQIDSLYDRGEQIADYRHQARQFDFFTGWSNGLHNGWTKRFSAGLALDEHEFSSTPGAEIPSPLVPDNRRLVYPFVGIEWLQDKFEKASNLDQIDRTEDRFLGTRVSARLGLASADVGSDRDAWILNAAAQTGFGSSAKNSLLLGANFDSRVESGDFQNLTLDVSARYFRRQSEHRLLYVGLTGTFGQDLDMDQHLLLGGETGLRGYPLRYQSGDKQALLTVEQRFFSDWYPFRLVHVGGAVFFDVGRAWGETPVSALPNEWLRDVGFGLRLGNARSGLGRMTHIDIAFPLDGDSDISDLQFLISTKKSF